MVYHLRELRIRMGLGHAQLAELLHVSRQAYAQYESGKRTPGVDVLRKMSEVLQVPADYLLTEGDVLAEELTGDEKRILDIYRQLDGRGQQTVQTMMVFEHLRFGEDDLPAR